MVVRFQPDRITPEFKEEVERANAPLIMGGDRYSRGFSSGRVAAMSPEEHSFTLDHVASLQRGHPETVMGQVQRVTRGGILSWLSEHVGDLTHRLNEGGGAFGTEFVAPKVHSALRTLEHGYGVEREHNEQMASVGVDPDELQRVCAEYANAHRGLPVYNQPSAHARNAAIRVGQHDFKGATRSLTLLKRDISDPDLFRHLMSQQGSVEFLKMQEDR